MPQFGARYIVRFPKGTLSDFPVKILQNEKQGWRAKILDEPYFALSGNDSDELFIRDNYAPHEMNHIEKQLVSSILPAFIQNFTKLVDLKVQQDEEHLAAALKKEQAEKERTERLEALNQSKSEMEQELLALQASLESPVNIGSDQEELLENIIKKHQARLIPPPLPAGFLSRYAFFKDPEGEKILIKRNNKNWDSEAREALQSEINQLNDPDIVEKIQQTHLQEIRQLINKKTAELQQIANSINLLSVTVDEGESEDSHQTSKKSLIEQAESNDMSERLNALQAIAVDALDKLESLEFIDKNNTSLI